MNARQMYSRVGVEADIDSLDASREATRAVLRALRDRLTPEEADHALAQLPQELKSLWISSPLAPRWPIKLHRREFLQRVRVDAGPKSLGQAEIVTDAVFAGLKEQLSPGEVDDMGTLGRTGLERFMRGSVAECVIRRAPCPVLRVRPPTDNTGGAA